MIVARGDLREARAAGALAVAGMSSLRVVAALLASGRQQPSRRAIRQREERLPAAPARTGAATREGGPAHARAREEPLNQTPRASPSGAPAAVNGERGR